MVALELVEALPKGFDFSAEVCIAELQVFGSSLISVELVEEFVPL